MAELDTRFNQAQTFASAHYAVGGGGEVHQYVEEANTAFHAGIVVNATWRLLKAGVNPNRYTIGIEMAGSPGDTPSDALYDSLAALIREIAPANQIAMDADHIVLHSEIRTGRVCPGDGFLKGRLLARLSAATAPAPTSGGQERAVTLVTRGNVREGAASTSARIVRVSASGATETVIDFTDRGERVQNNAYWYRTADGNYLWAGATNEPHPNWADPPASAAVPATPLPTATAVACGIQRIDDLWAGSAAALPIDESETDASAIGAIQDLLTGQGFPGLPSVLSSAYGSFGPKTANAIRSFQDARALSSSGKVDTATLKGLIANPAADPRASQVYLALVLGFPVTGMQRVLSLTAQMEGVGKFAALNRNSDRAGLSFGIIQWAQKPGRLAEILQAMSNADREQFVEIFGGGDEVVADSVIVHTRKLSGGVDPKTGVTVDPSFDLVNEPWVTRFHSAALVPRFQQVQVQTALRAFESSFARLRSYAPQFTSERSVGFLLDVANQFGDAGAERLFRSVYQTGMTELDALGAIADASVARMDDSLKAGVRARRDRFLETRWLSDQTLLPTAGKTASV